MKVSLDGTLGIFRAVGEETRLRIMALLVCGDLTVSEITSILAQSQPRVSRHLKILAEAGLAERHREGAWMFYRAASPLENKEIAGVLETVRTMSHSGDRILARDRERFTQSREARAALAAKYFQENAKEWNRIRQLHLPEADIEEKLRDIVGSDDVDLFIDLGTGSGRMLEIFSDRFQRGIGFDLSHEMLAVARNNLENADIENAQVRHGDLFAIPHEGGQADIVCIHHVLHYLAAPEDAVREAARLLKPGGKIIVSDFAPHDLEFLREEHAHRRLGFADEEVSDWFDGAGLTLKQTEALSPNSRDDKKLTVKIWLAEAPAGVRRLHDQKVTRA